MPKRVGISLIKRLDSDVWQYYIRYKGKTYRGSTGEKDREKSEEAAYKIQYAITKKSDVVSQGNISVNEFIELYLKYVEQELRRETLKSYKSVARTLKKFLQDKYPYIKLLKEITPEIIEVFKSCRIEQVSLTSAHNSIKNLKRMFKWAIEHNPPLISSNPLDSVKNLSKKKIRETQKPVVILTLEEFKKFVGHTKKQYPELYPLYMVYMYTGARKNELYTLEWNDVDFDRKLIHIRYKEGFIPKTDERTLPLHNKLMEILQAIPRKGQYVFLDGKKPFLYPDKTKAKGIYESHKPYRYLALIMKAIGKPEFTRLHWLRHSFATIIAKDKGIKFAQEVLGHKDIKVTERYIHFDRDYLQENLNKIKALDMIFK